MQTKTEQKQTLLRSFMPALALSLTGLAALGVVQVLPVAEPARPVAVFAWQGDALAAVIHAGGRMLSPGGLPGSIIAIADDPDFAEHLYANGASLVLRADDTIGCTASRIKS